VKHLHAETGGAISARPVISELRAAERPRWDEFVRHSPSATFFHLSAWKGLIENVFEHDTRFLMAQRQGRIVGVLPLAQVKSRLFGHSVASLPFCVYGGVASEDAEAKAALHEEAVRIASRCGAQYLELRNRQPQQPDWPKQDLYVTFRREILPDVEANMSAIPRKQRAMVRKGIKFELRSELDDDTDRFFALYADNVHRHGTPGFAKRYFAFLQAAFGDACEVLTVVDPNGRPVSGVMSFYFRDEVLPYYAGDVADARELAANDFKYWELMRRACERGIRIFDYGRSKQGTGSFDFKKNWGFEPTALHYEYRLLKRESIPQNNPLNPRYRAFIALWRKMPRPLANMLGPHISRHLG
jgi:FemAB-related protein (PEP-CTERM system-associated)